MAYAQNPNQLTAGPMFAPAVARYWFARARSVRQRT